MSRAPVEILVAEFSSNLMSSTFLTNNAFAYNSAATADLAISVTEMEALFTFDMGKVMFANNAGTLFDNYCRKQLKGTTGFTEAGKSYYGYTGGSIGYGTDGFKVADVPNHLTGPTGSIMNGFLITSSTLDMKAPRTGATSDTRKDSGYVLQNVIEDEMMYTSNAMFTDPLIQTTFCTSANRDVLASDLYSLGVYAANHIIDVMAKDKLKEGDQQHVIANNIFETVTLNRTLIANDKIGFVNGDALTWNVVVMPSQAQSQVMASAKGINARTYTFRLFCNDGENKHIPVSDRMNIPLYSFLTYYGASGPTGLNQYVDKDVNWATYAGRTGYTGSNGVRTFGAQYIPYDASIPRPV
jgi:hypothetical protein